ncbi:MAG: carboxypeptidase-like regulatory domain-containing protein [bacterium]
MQNKPILSIFLFFLLLSFTAYGATKTYSIQGKVLSPKSDSVEGAIVRINLNHELTIKTNKDGMFEWNNEKQPAFVIEAWHSQYPEYKAISIIENSKEPYALLTLKHTIGIKGRITNKVKEPIKNAKIYLETAVGAWSASSFARITTVISDTNGNYLIQDLVSDQVYRLAIYADNYVRIVTEPFVASRTWLNSALQKLEWIQMEPGNRITVMVTTANDKSFLGAQVTAGGKDWSYCDIATTDSKGKAMLSNLPLKNVHIDVIYSGTETHSENYSFIDPTKVLQIQLQCHGDDIWRRGP